MAESYAEKRRRELGLTAAQPSSTDFVKQRRMDLGMVDDTRIKESTSKAMLANSGNTMQDVISGKTSAKTFTTELTKSVAPITAKRKAAEDSGKKKKVTKEVVQAKLPKKYGDQVIFQKSKKTLKALNDIPDIATNEMSFGLTDLVSRKLGVETREEQVKRNSGATGIAGKVIGSIQPGLLAEKAAAALLKPIIKNSPKILQGAARGAGAGLLYGAASETGKALTHDNDMTLQERLINAGVITGAGGVIGAAAPAIGAGLKKVAPIINDAFKNSKVGQAFADFLGRNKPIEQPQTQPVLGLPSPRQRGNVNTAVTPDVVTPYGESAQLGLPESPRYNEIQRLKNEETLGLPSSARYDQIKQRTAPLEPNTTPVVSYGESAVLGLPDATLPRVVQEIRQEVSQRITPPFENQNELAKYVQTQLGGRVSLNEVRTLSYEDLTHLADEIHKVHLRNADDMAAQVARERGLDWNDLQQGRSVTGNAAQSTERVGRAPTKPEKLTKKQQAAQQRAQQEGQPPVVAQPAEQPKLFTREQEAQSTANVQADLARRQQINELSKPIVGNRTQAQSAVEAPIVKRLPDTVSDMEIKGLQAGVMPDDYQIGSMSDDQIKRLINGTPEPTVVNSPKSLIDNSDFGTSGMPITKVGRAPQAVEVDITPPTRKFPEQQGAEQPARLTRPPGANAANESPKAGQAADTQAPSLPRPPRAQSPAGKTKLPKITQQRGFVTSIKASDTVADEVKEGVNSTYTTKTNEATVAAANKRVDAGVDAAEAYVLGKKKADAESIATGIRLIQKLQSSGNTQRAVTVAEQISKQLTEAGQTVQVASILNKLTPEGRLINAQRTVNRINQVAGKEVVKITPDQAESIVAAATTMQKAGASKERAALVHEIMTKAKNGGDISDADRKIVTDFVEDARQFIKPKESGLPKPPKQARPPKEMNDKRVRDRVNDFFAKQEAAAKQRLKDRGIQVSSLPLDVWGDQIIVGAAKMARGTIKFADWSEQMAKDLGEGIRPHLAKIYEQAQDVVSKRARSIDEQTISKAERVAEQYLKKKELSLDDANKIRDLAKRVSELSGDDAAKADMHLQKIMNGFERSSLGGKIQAMRYMAMLLNTGTQSINAISGPIMATTGYAADIFGTMIDITLSAALKKPRTTTLYGTNPLKFIARYIKNAKVGGKAGWEGVNPSGIAGPNEVRGLAFKSLKNPLGIAERTLGAVAKGADYATYKAVQQSELTKIAFLDARNNGIKGKQAIKDHIDQYLLDPPPEAILQADRIGKNTTFQRNDTTGGETAQWLNQAPRLLKPAVTSIVPFVRTPINIASTAVTMTPGGIIKGLYQLTSKTTDASKREAIRTLSMGLTGSGIGVVGYYLSQLGIITGANDSGNRDVDSIKEQAGQGKYRLNTSALGRYWRAMISGEGSEAAEKAAQFQKGDKQFDYNKLQPIAYSLAIGAGVKDNLEKDTVGTAVGAGTDAFGSLFGMSTLKGVQDVFQPQYGGTQGEKALGAPTRVLESFLKSFSPSLLAQEARRQDSIVRKAPYNDGVKNDVLGYYKSRTPGLSETMPPNKTTLGTNKLNAPGIKGQYLNPYKSEVAPYNEAAVIISDLIDKTGDPKLAPSPPDKNVSGKDKSGVHVTIVIPPKRYQQMQEDLGKSITQQILALPKSMDDGEKEQKILEIYSDARTKERNKVKEEFGIQVR